MTSGTSSCTHVYCVYLNAAPETVWDAIVNPDLNGRYGYRVRCAYDLRPDGAFMGFPSEEMRLLGVPNAVADGVVLVVDPPRRFVHTWRMLVSPELASEGFSQARGRSTEAGSA